MMLLHFRSAWVLVLLVVLSLLLAMTTLAAVDVYEFDTELQRQRYQRLSEELRCPKCPNQHLAGSDSQIAGDLRRELHRLLLKGKTDSEIRDFMLARYGDFVLYKPRLQAATLVLWVLPIVLLLLGVWVIRSLVSRRVSVQPADSGGGKEADATTSLSEQEVTALQQVISRYHSSGTQAPPLNNTLQQHVPQQTDEGSAS